MEIEEFNEIIKRFNNLFKEKKIEEAEKLIDSTIENIKIVDINEYGKVLDFRDKLQFIYYCQGNKEVNISWTKNFLPNLYLAKGVILYEKKLYHEAIDVLKKGLRWNPMAIDIYFEILEICIKLRDRKIFRDYFEKAKDVALTPLDLAILYKTYAVFCVDEGQKELAYNLLLYSKVFFPRRETDIELDYLENLEGLKLKRWPDLGTIEYIRRQGLEYRKNDKIVSAYIQNIKINLQELGKQETQYLFEDTIRLYQDLYFFEPDDKIYLGLVKITKDYEKFRRKNDILS